MFFVASSVAVVDHGSHDRCCEHGHALPAAGAMPVAMATWRARAWPSSGNLPQRDRQNSAPHRSRPHRAASLRGPFARPQPCPRPSHVNPCQESGRPSPGERHVERARTFLGVPELLWALPRRTHPPDLDVRACSVDHTARSSVPWIAKELSFTTCRDFETPCTALVACRPMSSAVWSLPFVWESAEISGSLPGIRRRADPVSNGAITRKVPSVTLASGQALRTTPR